MKLSKSNVAHSWKSTAIGAVLAGLLATYTIVDAIDPHTVFTALAIVLLVIKCLFVFLIAAFGAMVKDWNVTGDPPTQVNETDLPPTNNKDQP